MSVVPYVFGLFNLSMLYISIALHVFDVMRLMLYNLAQHQRSTYIHTYIQINNNFFLDPVLTDKNYSDTAETTTDTPGMTEDILIVEGTVEGTEADHLVTTHEVGTMVTGIADMVGDQEGTIMVSIPRLYRSGVESAHVLHLYDSYFI
jgi:hypothetical protein